MAALVLLSAHSGAGASHQDRIRADEGLVIPGVGSEKICVGDSYDAVRRVKGRSSYRVVSAKTDKNFLFDVLKIKSCGLHIPFDAIWYFYNSQLIVLFNAGKVSGVCTSNKDRVTSEGVAIGKGISFFVYSYGNEGLLRCGDGVHKIHVYPQRGIALFDDHGDDNIDMVLVFDPR